MYYIYKSKEGVKVVQVQKELNTKQIKKKTGLIVMFCIQANSLESN